MSLVREVSATVFKVNQQNVKNPGVYTPLSTSLDVGTNNYFLINQDLADTPASVTLSSITGGSVGQVVVLAFADTSYHTTVAGSAIKLSGAFVSTNNDTLTIVFNGTNWLEVSRSVNA